MSNTVLENNNALVATTVIKWFLFPFLLRQQMIQMILGSPSAILSALSLSFSSHHENEIDNHGRHYEFGL